MLSQLERSRRYLERIERLYEGRAPVHENQSYHDDDVISFFIHCYHVRDWILQLNKIGITRKEVDEFISQNLALSICADLCNGEKHCRLERSMRTERQPHLASKSYSVTHFTPASGEEPRTSGSFRILANGEFLDALSLARECIQLWEQFIANVKSRI